MRLVEDALTDAIKIKQHFMEEKTDVPESVGIFPSCAFILEN